MAFIQDDGGRPQQVIEDEVPIEKGHKYFINVGSVGQPRDGDWRASYAIYDKESKIVETRRLEYDVETSQRKIIEAGLPEGLATRLAEGH